jgi:hypothetical protein
MMRWLILVMCLTTSLSAQTPDSVRQFHSLHTDSIKLYYTRVDTVSLVDTVVPIPTLKRVVLEPQTATVAPLTTRSFAAYGTMTNGDSVPLTVTYTAEGGTVTATGLYTAGGTPGSYRVFARSGTLADTSQVTISNPQGSGTGLPWVSACTARSGVLTTLTGAQQRFDTRLTPLDANSRVDARGASWPKVGPYPVNWSTKTGSCWVGGRIVSSFDSLTSWDTYHSSAGLYVYGPDALVEGVRIVHYGDGIRFTPLGTKNWALKDSWIEGHDDCIENDRLEVGLVENVLMECYQAFSARPGDAFASQVDGRNNTVTVRNSLVWVRRQVGVYKGASPGSAGFFKTEPDNKAINVRWRLEGNLFRVDGPATVGNLCLNPDNVVKSATNNVILWLGAGAYPCLPIPSGWTLITDKKVWDNAVADWKLRHPDVL